MKVSPRNMSYLQWFLHDDVHNTTPENKSIFLKVKLTISCILWYFYLGGRYAPCCFALNNSETVKTVTLTFRSIRWFLIRDIRAKFGIPNLPQFPDVGQNSLGCISDFWISVQSFFFIRVFFHDHSQITGLQGKGEGDSLLPLPSVSQTLRH